MTINFKKKMVAGTARIYPNDRATRSLLDFLKTGGSTRQTFSTKALELLKQFLDEIGDYELKIEEEIDE